MKHHLLQIIKEKTSLPSDFPEGKIKIDSMLQKTNYRQFTGVNIVAFLFIIYIFTSRLFIVQSWEPYQQKAYFILDVLFSFIVLFSFGVIYLSVRFITLKRFMYWYRLLYLAFIVSWAAAVSVFESLTTNGVYTYTIVVLIVSLAFFHKIRELLIILTAGQITFLVMINTIPFTLPNKDHLISISWGIITGCIFISRIPYFARRQGIIYELTMRKAFEDREQANQAKTDFLRNISHELRTPLTGILGFSEAIMHQTMEKSTAKYSGLILNEGEKLLTLINRLLDISKIESGKFELRPKPFDLRHSLQVFIESYSERARLKGIKFRFEIPNELPDSVIGDEEQLIQVLTNLVGNAIKFTKHGIITLLVSVTALHRKNVRICFEVSDTGVGIEKSKQSDIFKPFFQEDGSISREFGGTGLGTTISQKLVQLMGGTIELESEKNKGSRFWFSLDFPIAGRQNNESQGVKPSLHIQLAHKRILLIEDYAINQKIAKMYLEGLGCEVCIAENGLEGLKVLRSEAFDAVFLDIQMPVMDGLETLKIIRQTEELRHNLIIGITANAFDEDRNKYLSAGMDDILLKPFRRKEIEETLKKAFGSEVRNIS